MPLHNTIISFYHYFENEKKNEIKLLKQNLEKNSPFRLPPKKNLDWLFFRAGDNCETAVAVEAAAGAEKSAKDTCGDEEKEWRERATAELVITPAEIHPSKLIFRSSTGFLWNCADSGDGSAAENWRNWKRCAAEKRLVGGEDRRSNDQTDIILSNLMKGRWRNYLLAAAKVAKA